MNSPRPTSKLSPFEANLLRDRAFRLIKTKSFARGDFVLASGKRSNYYLDLKPTMFDPEGANALAEMILDRLDGVSVDCVGGMALGAVPLITAVSMLSHRQNRPLPGFFVRKEVKDHGTMQRVDGLARGETLAGRNVVILEDVTTTGGSSMMAVGAARASGANVTLVLSVVDREEGAVEFYRQQGISFAALFIARDFMNA